MPIAARSAIKSLIVAGLLVIVVTYHVRRFPVTQTGIDFPEFYCAAKMVLSGAGHQLYDIHAQQRFQMQYTGRVGVLFNHPPFDALFYLPSALLPYPRGYLLWTIISAAVLALAACLVNREANVFRDSGMLVMLFFVFAPLQLDLMQGQDDALLLLIYVLLYVALRREGLFIAGAILALGLFKPHLVLPCFVIVLIARRSGRFLAGFAAVAALLGVISLAISGAGALLAYPGFVINLSRVRLAGYHPAAMANWRGLISLVTPPSPLQTAMLIAGSLLLLWLAVAGFAPSLATPQNRAAFDLGFSNLVAVTLLVSYHLSPHDLTLLLIPLALIARHLREFGISRDPVRSVLLLLALALFLPPLPVYALIRHTYAWMALPVLLFSAFVFCAVRRLGRGAAARHAGLHS